MELRTNQRSEHACKTFAELNFLEFNLCMLAIFGVCCAIIIKYDYRVCCEGKGTDNGAPLESSSDPWVKYTRINPTRSNFQQWLSESLYRIFLGAEAFLMQRALAI